jgi:hypothetical protein
MCVQDVYKVVVLILVQAEIEARWHLDRTQIILSVYHELEMALCIESLAVDCSAVITFSARQVLIASAFC